MLQFKLISVFVHDGEIVAAEVFCHAPRSFPRESAAALSAALLYRAAAGKASGEKGENGR
jgi:hypothetical protein